ncbi:MAG: FAD-dependent oxidoreductase [Pyrinomonadaceae bacterium]
MMLATNNFDVIIAGAGPAGASAAIHLVQRGIRVLLVEQKSFPREKLCGEFISPECYKYFQELGVREQVMNAQPALLRETRFYSRNGQCVSVPSNWFAAGPALGLSRSLMDNILLRRAKTVGVVVVQDATVNDVIEIDGRIGGVRIRWQGGEHTCRSPLVIDATGRSRTLMRKTDPHVRERTRMKMVAMKAHFRDTKVAAGVCEIYCYRGGYGGLSTIEEGMSNLCFIASARDVRRVQSSPDLLLNETVLKNRRALKTMEHATICSEWLSVAFESFGRRSLSPIPGLLAIGDSAAFIDPFTGSGILLALESGKLAAEIINKHRPVLNDFTSLVNLSRVYRREYTNAFTSRFRVSGLLRRAAFRPRWAEFAIRACAVNGRLRNRLARATRGSRTTPESILGSVK